MAFRGFEGEERFQDSGLELSEFQGLLNAYTSNPLKNKPTQQKLSPKTTAKTWEVSMKPRKYLKNSNPEYSPNLYPYENDTPMKTEPLLVTLQ